MDKKLVIENAKKVVNKLLSDGNEGKDIYVFGNDVLLSIHTKQYLLDNGVIRSDNAHMCACFYLTDKFIDDIYMNKMVVDIEKFINSQNVKSK